jgi:predicted small secreted protein
VHRPFAILICSFLIAGLSGCETIKGAGKDIEKAGEAIQRAAR